jgi:hypothetical protein
MNDITDAAPKIKYRWPRYLLAAVLLSIVLYFVWVGLEVRHVERERDLNAPLPTQNPVH